MSPQQHRGDDDDEDEEQQQIGDVERYVHGHAHVCLDRRDRDASPRQLLARRHHDDLAGTAAELPGRVVPHPYRIGGRDPGQQHQCNGTGCCDRAGPPIHAKRR